MQWDRLRHVADAPNQWFLLKDNYRLNLALVQRREGGVKT